MSETELHDQANMIDPASIPASPIKLVDVHTMRNVSIPLLYRLLVERAPSERVNPQPVPTWEAHVNFVDGKPYVAWYVVLHMDTPVGACALETEHEVGVGILREHRRRGYATHAVTQLAHLNPRDWYEANINPLNIGSLELFNKLGFKHRQGTLWTYGNYPTTSEPSSGLVKTAS